MTQKDIDALVRKKVEAAVQRLKNKIIKTIDDQPDDYEAIRQVLLVVRN